MTKEQMMQKMQEDEKWIQIMSKVDKGFLTKRIRTLEIKVKAYKLMMGIN